MNNRVIVNVMRKLFLSIFSFGVINACCCECCKDCFGSKSPGLHLGPDKDKKGGGNPGEEKDGGNPGKEKEFGKHSISKGKKVVFKDVVNNLNVGKNVLLRITTNGEIRYSCGDGLEHLISENEAFIIVFCTAEGNKSGRIFTRVKDAKVKNGKLECHGFFNAESARRGEECFKYDLFFDNEGEIKFDKEPYNEYNNEKLGPIRGDFVEGNNTAAGNVLDLKGFFEFVKDDYVCEEITGFKDGE